MSFRNRVNHLLRSYPSLNLRLEVHRDQYKALALLPGLRYDDISFTGQPDLHRLMNITSRLEHASLYSSNLSFLDYQGLNSKGIGSYAHGMLMEIKRHFYETTTAKSPIQVSLQLTGMMDTMFTIRSSATFGGRQRASIMLKTCNKLVHRESGLAEQIPEWWRKKFIRFLPEKPDNYRPISPPDTIGKTFSHHVCVPLQDTDTSGRTRHPSYVRYFIDNISIAANKKFYPSLTNSLHDHYVRRIAMVHIEPTLWGDALTVETFQDSEDENRFHCIVGKAGSVCWYGYLEYYQRSYEAPIKIPSFLENYPR